MKRIQLTRPDYLGTAVRHFDLLTQNYSDERFSTEVQNKNVRWTINLMAGYATFYEATRDNKYLDLAKSTFTIAAEAWINDETLMIGTDDFFATQNLATVYRVLKENNQIGTEYDEIVLKFADKHFQPTFVADHNQAQERAIGFVRMYNLFPEYVNAPSWREYTEQVWNFWYPHKDIDETATNYASIHLDDILKIAAESGKSDLLVNEDIRKWFERYRDQQAPSGFMPEYGDDYFFAYYVWVAVFEKMARVFNDGTFLEAAWKLFYVGYPNLDAKNSSPGFDMRTAADWIHFAEITLLPEINLQPVPTDANVLVTTRTNKYGVTGIPDQFLMSNSKEPGVPFIMSDLYARGGHSHSNLRGTVNYYESDSYPLFHGVERNATDARCGNTVVLLKQDNEGFPFAEGDSRSQTNKWFIDKLDFSTGTNISESDPKLKGFDELTFRFQGQTGEEIYIDNVRLEGKAGVRIIHDCNTLDNWPQRPDLVQLSDDAIDGKSVKVTLPGTTVLFVGLKVEAEFSLDDYQYITIDWKHKAANGADNSTLNFILRAHNKVVYPGDEYVQAQVGTLFNTNTIQSTYTELRENDCYGEVILGDHFTSGSSLTRRMLLTAEGVLILQDRLLPGEGTDGYTGGSIWQLYRLDERGDNWFNSPGEAKSWFDIEGNGKTKELLVYFENKENRQYGYQFGDYTVNPAIVNTRESVTPGQPITFVTILVPHDDTWSPTKMAEIITSETSDDMQSNISVGLKGMTLDVVLNADRTWTIGRRETPTDPTDPEGPGGKNLITNGDISILVGSGALDWSAQGTSDFRVHCTIDKTVYTSPEASFRIKGDGVGWRGWRHTDFMVEAGKTYVISYFVKTENVSAASKVYCSFGIKAVDGSTLIGNVPNTNSFLGDQVKGTHDWTKIEGEYTIPENGGYISAFCPRMDSDGTAEQYAWYDDFEVREKTQD